MDLDFGIDLKLKFKDSLNFRFAQISRFRKIDILDRSGFLRRTRKSTPFYSYALPRGRKSEVLISGISRLTGISRFQETHDFRNLTINATVLNQCAIRVPHSACTSPRPRSGPTGVSRGRRPPVGPCWRQPRWQANPFVFCFKLNYPLATPV